MTCDYELKGCKEIATYAIHYPLKGEVLLSLKKSIYNHVFEVYYGCDSCVKDQSLLSSRTKLDIFSLTGMPMYVRKL